MEGVTSYRSYLTDLKRVREYLSRVAPVNFDLSSFPQGEEINQFLKSKVHNYNCYSVLLNNKPVLKPHKQKVKITKTGFDEIIGIKPFELTFGSEVAAYGWYGVRKDLIGSIVRGDDSAGIVVRVGNILLGDSHLLDRCFKENRFNSYLMGEIHVVHPELIPNSRRDDFIDNRAKALFYGAVEKEIGFPFSKEIRARSRKNYGFHRPSFSLTPRSGAQARESR